MNRKPAYSAVTRPHEVVCISVRESRPNQITEGETYILDLDSFYLDSDGDAYGNIYTQNMIPVGNMMLRHFASV